MQTGLFVHGSKLFVDLIAAYTKVKCGNWLDFTQSYRSQHSRLFYRYSTQLTHANGRFFAIVSIRTW